MNRAIKMAIKMDCLKEALTSKKARFKVRDITGNVRIFTDAEVNDFIEMIKKHGLNNLDHVTFGDTLYNPRHIISIEVLKG